MKSLSNFGSKLLAVALACSVLIAAGGPSAYAQDKKPDPAKTIKNAKVGKPYNEAVAAIQAKEWDKALAKLDEARAFEKKTPYESFKIDELSVIAYAQLNRIPEAITVWERMLQATEFHEPERHAILPKQLAVAYFQQQNFEKTIEYGKRYLETNPKDVDIVTRVADAAYRLKDFAMAREYMGKAISHAEGAGEVPKENWLRYMQSTSQELKDDAGVNSAYEKMLRYYPKPETWDRYTARLLFKENSDRSIFQLLRLMSDVDVLRTADQFMEYASLAMDNALPAEAARAMQKGFDKKVLGLEGSKDKDAQQRLLTRSKQSAKSDEAQLPQSEKDAASEKATAGVVAGLGLAYFSFEQYEKAIAPLQTGLKKGGLKNVEDYQLALGISQLKAGQKEAARETFKSIPADSPLFKAANAWVLRTYH